MPTGDDLIGLGMPSELARSLGNSPNALACTGTSSATAATIKTHLVELVPSSSNTGAIFQSSAKVGSPHYFFNAQSTSAVIYVPSGDTFNGTLNGTFTLAQNKSAIITKYKVSAGAGYWASVLTA
jgi:hypothetical protein